MNYFISFSHSLTYYIVSFKSLVFNFNSIYNRNTITLDGDTLKLKYIKHVIGIGLLLVFVLIFTACSGKEDDTDYSVIKTLDKIPDLTSQIPDSIDVMSPVSDSTDLINPLPDSSDVVSPAPDSTDPISPIPDSTDDVSPTPDSMDLIRPIPDTSDDVSPAPNSSDLINPIPDSSDDVSPAPDSTDDAVNSDIPLPNDPVIQGEDSLTASEGEGSSAAEPGLFPEDRGRMIAIDAGHQSKVTGGKEPVGPGASETKPKVSSGTQGIVSGMAEYELNLIIAQMVREELIDRGYEVFMVRDTNDVDLSNKERSAMANESGADLFIRIHADSFSDADVNGVSTLYPSADNPYVAQLSSKSLKLSKSILNNIFKLTGAKSRGTIPRDDMTGINWCSIPVTIVEMGFMSNVKEDKLMQTKDYQNKIVIGICDGITSYFDGAVDE